MRASCFKRKEPKVAVPAMVHHGAIFHFLLASHKLRLHQHVSLGMCRFQGAKSGPSQTAGASVFDSLLRSLDLSCGGVLDEAKNSGWRSKAIKIHGVSYIHYEPFHEDYIIKIIKHSPMKVHKTLLRQILQWRCQKQL